MLGLRSYRSQDCKLVLMKVQYSNTSFRWKCIDHLKFVFNIIGLAHFIINERGATSGAGTAYPSGAPEFAPGF